MALFGLFKKKGRGATDTIDLTRMQSVKDKLAADSSSSSSTPSTFDSTDASSMPAMDLPMGTFDQNISSTQTSTVSISPDKASRLDALLGKLDTLYMRIDLLEHKVDRLERKTGIKTDDQTQTY